MTITEADLEVARQAWSDGLIAISQAHQTSGVEGARSVAERVIDDAYGYELGPVLFKPTMASGDQTFRLTRAGAISYFVGDDPDFPDDSGFALNGWRKVDSTTAASFVDGNVAMWMGRMVLTNDRGEVTTVDKSFGYQRESGGGLRIVLHHSSLPYER